MVASGHTVEIQVVQGDHPSGAIVEIAASRHVRAELVIAGSMRRTGSKREGFGSVATALFRDLPLPLLVVGPDTRRYGERGAA